MEENNFDVFSAPTSEDFQPQPAETSPVSEDFQFPSAENSPVEQNDSAPVSKGKADPKKLLVMAGAAIVAVIVIIVLLCSLGNTYKTPIKAAEDLLNTKSLTKIIDKAPSVLNGFGESEAKKILKTIKKCDQYEDVIEEAEEGFDELIEVLEDEVGKNYKIKLKIDDKEKLESSDLKAFRNNLRDISEMAEALEDLDSDDYEDMADELGLSKKQVKNMIKQVEAFAKDCKSAKVSKGYELDLIVTVTGRELDEPEEMDITVRVFKVDGRWVPDVFSLANLVDIDDLMYMMGGF